MLGYFKTRNSDISHAAMDVGRRAIRRQRHRSNDARHSVCIAFSEVWGLERAGIADAAFYHGERFGARWL